MNGWLVAGAVAAGVWMLSRDSKPAPVRGYAISLRQGKLSDAKMDRFAALMYREGATKSAGTDAGIDMLFYDISPAEAKRLVAKARKVGFAVRAKKFAYD